MASIDYNKDGLIEGLWLPKARDAKAFFYPRRKNNAQMTLLTMSDGINLNEIFKLEEEEIILREGCSACVTTMHKRVRVEAESVGPVVDGRVYDRSFLDSGSPLEGYFPFDIVNLDFCSQDPALRQGRIKEEIKILEKVMGIQSDKACKRFLLIYTTILDSNNIDAPGIVATLRSDGVDGWEDVSQGRFSNSLSDPYLKQEFLEELFNRIPNNYGFERHGEVSCQAVNCPASPFEAISIAVIIMR
jgi:hypothetical protein